MLQRRNSNIAGSGIGTTKTKFVSVYETLPFPDGGVTNIKSSKGKAGVYFIKEDNKLVYIGHSTSDLYTTILRHFHRGQRERVSNYNDRMYSNNYTVRVIFTTSKQALDWEGVLINKFKPRDNEYLKFGDLKNAKQRYRFIKTKIDDSDEVPF